MEKDLKRVIDKGLKEATRIADSLEKLVNEPLVELKPPPPQCPHCGKINPRIQVDYDDNPEIRGYISEWVLVCQCLECDKPIFGIVNEWFLTPNREEASVLANQIIERVKNG